MEVIRKCLDIKPAYNFNRVSSNNDNIEAINNGINEEDIVFFDIETTGLSAINSVLYLIGVVYYEDDSWKFEQWFADECDDEVNLIKKFFELLDTRKYLVHYNGNGFDIPYIKKKIEQYSLDYSFDNIESIDLYNTARKYKGLLKLQNCKLVTIEKYIGIIREEKYSGKELIDTYKEFIKVCSLEKLKGSFERSSVLKKDLLLHNEEDIINLLEVSKIRYLDEIFTGNVIFDDYSLENDIFMINYHTDYNIPLKERIIVEEKNYRIIIGDNENYDYLDELNKIRVIVPIFDRNLKYFYPDYKNYYYLRNEDMAIHKSVAKFVDKEYREQAKPANCYIEKNDRFVPAFSTMNVPKFKESYDSTESAYQLSSILKNNENVDLYGKTVIKNRTNI